MRPDFDDRYPIDLFRMFLPSQWEILDNSRKNLLSWYLNRSIEVIWNFGIKGHKEFPGRPITRYDVCSAASSYLSPISGVARQSFQPYYGGLFDLRKWVGGVFSYCNGADLNALAQLACSMILDVNGKEVLDSKWIVGIGNPVLGRDYFGYIKSGPLFGWVEYPSCNSHIWAGGHAYYASEENDQRIPIYKHVWIEVMSPEKGYPVVIDPSQCLGNTKLPPSGELSREEYIKTKLDLEWKPPASLPPRQPLRSNAEAVLFSKFTLLR